MEESFEHLEQNLSVEQNFKVNKKNFVKDLFNKKRLDKGQSLEVMRCQIVPM